MHDSCCTFVLLLHKGSWSPLQEFLGCCFAPTFLSVRNSCVFALHDLLKTDKNWLKLNKSDWSPKSVQKVSGTVRKDTCDTFQRLSADFPDCSRDFLETFRGSGARGLGRHFQDFFGISDPCKGRAGSQRLGRPLVKPIWGFPNLRTPRGQRIPLRTKLLPNRTSLFSNYFR